MLRGSILSVILLTSFGCAKSSDSGSSNRSDPLLEDIVQRETLIPKEYIQVYMPSPDSPVWYYGDIPYFAVRVKIFPILSTPPGEPYPITENLRDLELSHPKELLVAATSRRAAIGKFQKIKINFQDKQALLFKKTTDTKPKKTISLEALRFSPATTDPTEVIWNQGVVSNGKSKEVKLTYRGVFDLKDGQLINIIAMEQYLYSVVASEIYSTWPKTSLQVQAVAARTYALRQVLLARKSSADWDLDPTTRYQSYRGAKVEKPEIKEAVDSVQHEIMLYDKEVIEASFSANSGGVTCSSMECFGFETPYLLSVPDHASVYSAPDGSGHWKSQTDPQYGRNQLISKGLEAQLFKSYEPFDVGPSGRIWALAIRLTDGRLVSMLRADTKKAISKYRSSLFSLGELNSDGSQVINGSGYGHAVGMSQWGAYYYALEGKLSYQDILSHYYSHIHIEKMNQFLARRTTRRP